MGILEKILQKPETTRKKIAFLLTGFFGILLVSAWLFISSYNMKQALSKDKTNSNQLENFRASLPELKQTQTVQTELSKQMKNEQQ